MSSMLEDPFRNDNTASMTSDPTVLTIDVDRNMNHSHLVQGLYKVPSEKSTLHFFSSKMFGIKWHSFDQYLYDLMQKDKCQSVKVY